MGTDDNESGQAAGKAVDDRGTSEAEGREILRRLRDAGFEGSDEKFAVAMGRPVEEISGLLSGAQPVDDDLVMKARGIAKQRGVEIE